MLIIDDPVKGRVSIHTPARGVTKYLAKGNKVYVVSIHTPARGVTPLISLPGAFEIVSIHTPARGVTRKPTARHRGVGCFNPHSRAGSDDLGDHSPYTRRTFQSTLPRGE